jgi:hypothetical protein
MHNLVSCDLFEQLLADGKVQIIQLGAVESASGEPNQSVNGENLTKTGLRNLGLQSAPRKERIFLPWHRRCVCLGS